MENVCARLLNMTFHLMTHLNVLRSGVLPSNYSENFKDGENMKNKVHFNIICVVQCGWMREI